MSAVGVALVSGGWTAPLAAVAAVVVALTIVLLVAQEAARAAGGDRRDAPVRAFKAGAAPMLVIFVMVVAIQVARILQ